MERNRRIQATSFALPKRRNHDNIAQPSWASRGLSRPREHRPPASPARGDTTWPRCFAGAVFMAEIVILSAAYLGSLEFCLRVSSWHLHERFRAGTDLFRKACEFRHSLANVCARLMDGRSNLTNFEAIQRLRGDVSDMTQSAAQSGQGNKARLLRGVLHQLDQSLENASEGFFQANRNFAQASRDIEAVQAGRQAATRGRSEDIIPAYQALWPEAQAAFRAGYVDPLITQTQGAAFGVNKARPFLNDAFRDEAAAMAPGNSLMQRRETQGGNPSLARPPHFLFLSLSFAFASGFWASA